MSVLLPARENVILWDADDGGVLGRLQGEVSPVEAMLFCDDWRYLVSGSEREVIV